MSNENPYQTPSAIIDVEHDETILSEPRRVGAGSGWTWIADAFRLFAKSPLIWIVNTILFLVLMIVTAFIPFLNNVLGPIFTGGFMLGARALDNDEPLEVNHLFAGFSNEGGKLAIVGLLYLAGIFILFVLIAIIMLIGMFSMGIFETMVAQGGTPDPQLFLFLMAIFYLLFFALLMPLLMAYWFAPALVVFHKKDSMEAMKLSFVGCWRNMLPFLVYGIVGLVLLILASLPFFLGMIVMIPVLIASMYTAYKDIYT